MANAIYPKFKELALDVLLRGASAPAASVVKCALVDTGSYTFSTSHQFFSSLSASVIASSPAMTTKTVAAGIFDADDVTFTAVSGSSVEAYVLYIDTGSSATSPLVAYFDSATGLPFTPSGADVIMQWDNGANKIFAL